MQLHAVIEAATFFYNIIHKKMAVITVFVTLLILILFLIWYYYKRKYNYWSDRNVFSIQPILPFFGNFKISYFFKSNVEILDSIYRSLNGHPYGGVYLFNTPAIVVRDSELIKKILFTDFSYFVTRGFHTNQNDPLARNLIHVGRHEWKYMRTKHQAPFSVTKLKSMLPTIDSLAEDTLKEIENGNLLYSKDSAEYFDSIDLFGRFATDVISIFLYGFDSKAINMGDGSDIYRIGKTIPINFLFAFHILGGFLFPNLHKFFNIWIARKKTTDIVLALTQEILDLRKKERFQYRKDLLDAMLSMVNQRTNYDNNDVDSNDRLKFVYDENYIAANLAIYYTAAIDTVANTLGFAMYEMAINESVQAKAVEEIKSVFDGLNNIEINMENLKKMTYIESIVMETTRKYPQLLTIFRKCDVEYKMPDGGIIEPGTPIIIPIKSIHYNPVNYPEPDKFYPDRYCKENEENLDKYLQLSFGLGPRSCLAKQLTTIMIKVLIVRILSKYKVSVHPKWRNRKMGFHPKKFILSPIENIFIHLEPIKLNQQSK